MAVKNTLAPKKPETTDLTVEYTWGDSTIKLSPETVRQYLVNGNSEVTDQEVAMFINLCKYQHLNPFTKEAYLIKYGSSPATIVTGKEAFQKRAMRNPRFEGYQAGVIIAKKDSDGNATEFEYRTGALALGNEMLVGGWAKVFVEGYREPIEAAITYREYVGKKNNGEVNQQWSTRPATMLRKVALVQALREAFPEDLGGLYSSEEVAIGLDEVPILDPEENPNEGNIIDAPVVPPEQPATEEQLEF